MDEQLELACRYWVEDTGDPILMGCAPPPEVYRWVRGEGSPEDIEFAEEWVSKRAVLQARAQKVLDLMDEDIRRRHPGLPGWLDKPWSIFVRAPWGRALEDAVLEGEIELL